MLICMSRERYLTDELPVLPARLHLPVVCLDLDGVLNPITAKPPEGFVIYRVSMPARDLPQNSPFLRGHGHEDLEAPVWVNPRHAEWITELRKRADIYWSTTWENAANLHYAPLLGIEALPVIPHSVWPATFSDVKHGDSGHWKLYALSDLFQDRPLVWIDDAASRIETKYWRGKTPTLVITPDDWVGLTQADMERIDQFVDAQIELLARVEHPGVAEPTDDLGKS
jgi:hypothetical protein